MEEDKALRQRVLQDPAVLALVLSRFATVLGLSTLSYGSMVYLATVGAPQVVISSMGATRYRDTSRRGPPACRAQRWNDEAS